MKKRFPAFFLALALCLGLAVPAFAADATPELYTSISSASGAAYPYINIGNLAIKTNGPKNGQYVTEDSEYDFVMAAPMHEYFFVGVDGLAKGDDEALEVLAVTDHDGDGVYDVRYYVPQKKSSGAVTGIQILPVKGEQHTNDETALFAYAALIPGFEKFDEGNYGFRAAALHEFFGDNTLLEFYLGDNFLGCVLLSEGPFDDVPGVGWYSDPVAWAAEKGITTGTGDGEFTPGDDCTHIQILTFLSRAAGNTKAGDYDWATEQSMVIKWAKEKGMIDDNFNGQKSCTRAEAVNYIWQAKDKPSAQPSSFKDMKGYEQYAKAVDWAYEKGITKGSGNGIFDPGSVCNRAYIATFLYRAYN